MKFCEFVTEYDDSLSGDSYIDPLGVRVIWSTFGQRVFKSRVNSISNDVRNYTINLLNHAIVRALIDDDSVTVSPALEREIGEKHSLSFRQACLIYLENLITFIVVEAGESVDASGILGGSKAHQRLDNDTNPLITLSHVGKHQLLVRQLGLGVSGRYKTPFRALNFFNDHYDYHASPVIEETWQDAQAFIAGCAPLNAWYCECKVHLDALIGGATNKSRVPPGTTLSEVPESLKDACRQAFSSPQRVGDLSRTFWLKVTGLDRDAAGALLAELETAIKPNQGLSTEALVRAAQNRLQAHAETEKALLTNIAVIEPLLAEADLLFTLACQCKSQSLSDIEQHWHHYGRDAETLPRLADAIKRTPEIAAALTSTAFGRYQQLMALAQKTSLEAQLIGLLGYHALVMRQRGQLPWVKLWGDRVAVQARTTTPPDRNKRPVGQWVNSYYIPQFTNLAKGFYGCAS